MSPICPQEALNTAAVETCAAKFPHAHFLAILAAITRSTCADNMFLEHVNNQPRAFMLNVGVVWVHLRPPCTA
jgi:hypothetical protein